jgi:hypothetical protein
MQQTYDRSYDFDSRDPNVAVMARKSDGRWSHTTLGDVRCFPEFTHFYFVDEVDEEDVDEVEDQSSVELVRRSVDEMINWISQWSVRAPAVDEKLNEFRTQIFEHLDDVEAELDDAW